MTISNALGEAKDIQIIENLFDCPFCRSVSRTDGTSIKCENPACDTSLSKTALILRQENQRNDKERLEKEIAQARSVQEFVKKDREQRELEIDDTLTYARKYNYCITCLSKSGYTKFVQHRAECPKSGVYYE